MADKTVRFSACRCGRVRCRAVGPPIYSAVCYCNDCQAAGRQIEALPGAAPMLDTDGGTAYLGFRDDRFACTDGEELLVEHRLGGNGPTRRMVASCCNSAMFLKQEGSFWASTYRARYLGDDLPPVALRIFFARRTSDLPYPDDAPRYRGTPLRLYASGARARLAMLLGL